jgi:hypothetical protein
MSRTEVECRILTALKEKLVAPDLIAEFMDLIPVKGMPRKDADGVHLELAGDLARILPSAA